jgi:hypothetical protein
MRWTAWRRAAAILAVIVGVGLGASSVPASAAPTAGAAQTSASDWWW